MDRNSVTPVLSIEVGRVERDSALLHQLFQETAPQRRKAIRSAHRSLEAKVWGLRMVSRLGLVAVLGVIAAVGATFALINVPLAVLMAALAPPLYKGAVRAMKDEEALTPLLHNLETLRGWPGADLQQTQEMLRTAGCDDKTLKKIMGTAVVRKLNGLDISMTEMATTLSKLGVGRDNPTAHLASTTRSVAAGHRAAETARMPIANQQTDRSNTAWGIA